MCKGSGFFSALEILLSWHLFLQSQQWKHQVNVKYVQR